MKLTKIVDTDTIQCYKITNPTKKIKREFPNSFILSLDVLGEHRIFNSPQFPEKIIDCNPIGYIFTYDDIPNKNKIGTKAFRCR